MSQLLVDQATLLLRSAPSTPRKTGATYEAPEPTPLKASRKAIRKGQDDMKIAVVPAQVTAVRGRIIGSMGFSQVLLLIMHRSLSVPDCAILPIMGNAPYKYITMAVVTFVCAVLAIRIKGKIIANWLVAIIRYNIRPRYYLFNKNTTALRENLIA